MDAHIDFTLNPQLQERKHTVASWKPTGQRFRRGEMVLVLSLSPS